LHIKNIGEGLAKNVKATIAEDYEMFGIEKYKLSEVGIFESGFEIFPPDFELKFNINMMRDSYKIDQDNIMRLTFEYENIHGRKYNNEYNIPFNQIFGMAHSNPPGDYLGQIPFYLKKINIKLDQIKRKL